MLSLSIDTRILTDALVRYQAATRRDMVEVVKSQMAKLVNGVSSVNGLVKEALQEKYGVQAAIQGQASTGRLKRSVNKKTGRKTTFSAELARRLKYAAAIQATGWLNGRYGRPSRIANVAAVHNIDVPPGIVKESLDGAQPFIEIKNPTPRAAEFAAETGYVQRAVDNRVKDMLAYVEQKTQEGARAL